jgi:hypothetical protein
MLISSKAINDELLKGEYMKFIREFIQKRLPETHSSKYLNEGDGEVVISKNINKTEENKSIDSSLRKNK